VTEVLAKTELHAKAERATTSVIVPRDGRGRNATPWWTGVTATPVKMELNARRVEQVSSVNAQVDGQEKFAMCKKCPARLPQTDWALPSLEFVKMEASAEMKAFPIGVSVETAIQEVTAKTPLMLVLLIPVSMERLATTMAPPTAVPAPLGTRVPSASMMSTTAPPETLATMVARVTILWLDTLALVHQVPREYTAR